MWEGDPSDEIVLYQKGTIRASGGVLYLREENAVSKSESDNERFVTILCLFGNLKSPLHELGHSIRNPRSEELI